MPTVSPAQSTSPQSDSSELNSSPLPKPAFPLAAVVGAIAAIPLLVVSTFAVSDSVNTGRLGDAAPVELTTEDTSAPINLANSSDGGADQPVTNGVATGESAIGSLATDSMADLRPRTELIDVVTFPEARPTTIAAPTATTAVPVPDHADAPGLSRGSAGQAVQTLNDRLIQLGFRPNEDSSFSWKTWSAVLAFQKQEGLERTGRVNSSTWERLADPQGLLPSPYRVTPRVEVDLERQVAFYVQSPSVTTVLNVSTGNGATYTNSAGSPQRAYTPPGEFVIQRRIDGIRVADLGRLYRPLYFNGGIAIHGSNSVPGYPASHGCVRVSNNDVDWLFDKVPDGAPVIVHTSMRAANEFGPPDDADIDAFAKANAGPGLSTRVAGAPASDLALR